VSGLEIPILDGSALFFVNRIKEVGLHEQSAKKTFLTPKKTLVFEDKDHDRILKIVPARDTVLTFDYVADFEHPLLSKGELQGTMSLDFFITHIAAARTFGFLEQLPFLRRHGLAKGTTLGNTVVIGEEEFLNDKRFEDEFVRHKFLDLVGDLALLGKNLAGSIIAQKTGHNFNRLVVKHYVENPEEWCLI
jgi:UDP-3-O-[3-hydroxymyristoyl] N-acetylglucosamine deacetylase